MMRATAVMMWVTFAPGQLSARADETQAQISAPVGTVVQKVHAVGAQIYECKPDGRGSLAWSFREPIATLLSDGRTVGRHFAGPSWEMSDGSLVGGKAVAKAAGSSAGDIPWLRLGVTIHHGDGILNDVSIVQRIATTGGDKSGSCPSEGMFVSVPYAADYVFSRP